MIARVGVAGAGGEGGLHGRRGEVEHAARDRIGPPVRVRVAAQRQRAARYRSGAQP